MNRDAEDRAVMPNEKDIRWRRVLYKGDPGEAEYLNALAEVKAIRSELADLRSRLKEVGKIETLFDFDSTAIDCARAINLLLNSLYKLVEGARSFKAKAEQSREIWEDAHRNPDDYVIQDGTSK